MQARGWKPTARPDPSQLNLRIGQGLSPAPGLSQCYYGHRETRFFSELQFLPL